jgi:hypothetical protein
MLLRYQMVDVGRIANIIGAAGAKAPVGIARALNHTVLKARTQMIRALVPQTGLTYRTIRAALKVERASPGKLEASISSRGGNIRLKFFQPRETRSGVSAAPRGQRQVFSRTFMKGGQFPNRVALKSGKQVFVRKGKGRLPLTVVRSGVIIPQEMVDDASEAAFMSVARTELPPRIAHELLRLF